MEAARPRRARRPGRAAARRRVRAGGAGDRRGRAGRAAGRRAAGAARGGTAARGDRPRGPRADRRDGGGGLGRADRGWLADGAGEGDRAPTREALTVVVAEAGRRGGQRRLGPLRARAPAFATLWGGSTLPEWRAPGHLPGAGRLPGAAGRRPRLHAAPGGRVRRQPADPAAARLRSRSPRPRRTSTLRDDERAADGRRARHPEARRIRRGLPGVQRRPRLRSRCCARAPPRPARSPTPAALVNEVLDHRRRCPSCRATTALEVERVLPGAARVADDPAARRRRRTWSTRTGRRGAGGRGAHRGGRATGRHRPGSGRCWPRCASRWPVSRSVTPAGVGVSECYFRVTSRCR